MTKKDNEPSKDWFEDHEEYEEDDEDEEETEGLTEEEIREIEESLREREITNLQMQRFLMGQKKEVSLEKMLESSETIIESPFEKKEEENKISENNFDYLAKPEESQMKYQTMHSDTYLVNPTLSDPQKVLEEQKRIYTHIKVRGDMIGEDVNEEMAVRPEDTIKKDYLTKKKFTTGPY